MSCPGTPAVTFNYADWIAQFPAFANITSLAAAGFFAQATLYCANVLGPVPTVAQLTQLLYLLTCHLAFLQSPKDAQGNPSSTGTQTNNLVGRVSGATEGSVSVQTDNQYPPGTAQWYQQTVWGSAYWGATSVYRTMRYRPGVRRFGRGPFGNVGQPWLFPNGS